MTTRGQGGHSEPACGPFTHKAPSPSLLAKRAPVRGDLLPALCPPSPHAVPRCPARPSCTSRGRRCNSARSCRRWGSSPGWEGRCWRHPSGFTAGSSKEDQGLGRLGRVGGTVVGQGERWVRGGTTVRNHGTAVPRVLSPLQCSGQRVLFPIGKSLRHAGDTAGTWQGLAAQGRCPCSPTCSWM